MTAAIEPLRLIEQPYARRVARLDEIPPEIRDLPIWCAWKIIWQPGKAKPGKQPVSPMTGRESGWTDPQSGFCSSADLAIEYTERRKSMYGIGLVLYREHGIAGGDLDHCRNIETGEPTDQAATIIAEADTYTEVSPGLGGYRFLFFGSFGQHTGSDSKAGVEFYEDGRFLTFSGRHEESSPFAIERRDLTDLGKRHFKEKASTEGGSNAPDDFLPVDLDALGLPDYALRLIREGAEPGADRSERLFGAMKDLVRAGCDDSTICRVLADPSNDISECALERRRGDIGSAMKWIVPQIAKARADVAAEPPPVVIAIPAPASDEDPASLFDDLTLQKEDVEKMADAEFLIPNMIVRGHVAAYVSPANGGKTTIFVHLSEQLCRMGMRVLYINADGSPGDLKRHFEHAERHGYRVVAPDAKHGKGAADVLERLQAIAKSDARCDDLVFVIDTLKKFTDVIDKRQAKTFYGLMRSLTVRGATVCLLGHVNKYVGTDGKTIHEGTGDLRNDLDELIYLDVFKHEDCNTIEVTTRPDKVRAEFAPRSFVIHLDDDRRVSEPDKILQILTPEDRLMLDAIKDALRDGCVTQKEITRAVKESTGGGDKSIRAALHRHAHNPMSGISVARTGRGTDLHYSLSTKQGAEI